MRINIVIVIVIVVPKALARCLEPGNVCHSITRGTPKRQMKETLYIRHQNSVESMMVEKDRKATLQALYNDAVNKALTSQ